MNWTYTPASVNTKSEWQERSNLQSFETKGVHHLLVKVWPPTADFSFQHRTVADAEKKITLHACGNKKTPQFSPFIAAPAQYLSLSKTPGCLFLEKDSLLTHYLHLMSTPHTEWQDLKVHLSRNNSMGICCQHYPSKIYIWKITCKQLHITCWAVRWCSQTATLTPSTEKSKNKTFSKALL